MSKKKKIPEKREGFYQIRITESEKKDLQDVARSLNEPVSRLVRSALREKMFEIRRRQQAGELITL